MSTIGTIVVDPEGLVAKSTDLKNKVGSLATQFEVMNNLMKRTESYWLGEAGNYHRDMYNRSVEDNETLVKRIEEYSAKLENIAMNYRSTDNKQIQEAGALPGDVLG